MKTPQEKIRKAKEILSSLLKSGKTLAIHYACQSFTSETKIGTPTIVAISIRNVKTGENRLFSLLHSAEKLGKKITLNPEDILQFEKHMLKMFFSYIKNFKTHNWIHWNMSNDTYGFHALEHRANTLNIRNLFIIDDEHKCNLVGLLCGIYGTHKFAPHKLTTEENIEYRGQLNTLLALNKDISAKDLIAGDLEPIKFEELKWKEINLSTQRKTACIAEIAKQAELGKLQTQSSYWCRHGGFFHGIKDFLSNFWFGLIGGIIGGLSGIITLYKTFCE